ncbi:MAG: CinA family protein [Proteobacteria bacterium]|nr:CinA family protein [Pseudomonadota bacterium]
MIAAGLKLVTAESLTGGMIACALTEVPGASAVVDRGFVTYSNEAKVEMLGVSAGLIAQKGAVSREVALGMASGALERSRADIAVAVTGVAGPDGGTAEKPIGLVHVAAVRRGHEPVHAECRFGKLTRTEIRVQTVAAAFALVRQLAAAARTG